MQGNTIVTIALTKRFDRIICTVSANSPHYVGYSCAAKRSDLEAYRGIVRHEPHEVWLEAVQIASIIGTDPRQRAVAIMFQDDELIQEFVVESASHLADVEGQLLQIEAGGENINSDLVNTVFRAVHSVKGAAGFLGLSVINSLAHSLENVLNMIRNRELIPTNQVVNTMLRAADQLRGLVDNVSTSNEVDVTEFVAELEAIANGTTNAEPENSVDAVNSVALEIQSANIAESLHEIELAVRRQEDTSDSFDQQVFQPVAPAISEHYVAPEPPRAPAASAAAKSPAANKQDGQLTQHKQKSASDSIVRVNVALLDRLMNLAGELVLSRNQLLSAVTNGVREGLDNVASRIDQVTSELQETIMQTRMQPIGTIFAKFPRVVRDLSAKLGKECNLEIEGNEVEVDKTIVEAMGDPLTHLVRNSVDHGIERPDQRTAKGKPRVGSIRLRAFHQAGKVCIRIEDNGGGMDTARLKSKALEKGLISVDQASMMTDSEALATHFCTGIFNCGRSHRRERQRRRHGRGQNQH